ncbi:MAG: hypothetical protein ACOCG5_00270 [Candidatus Alkaliphilus sp. MAG34]|mgnify:CR=1 FL=1
MKINGRLRIVIDTKAIGARHHSYNIKRNKQEKGGQNAKSINHIK